MRQHLHLKLFRLTIYNMLPEQFTFWLNGFFEISDTNNLSEKQVQIIRDHLNLVFNKVTPKSSKTPNYSEVVDLLMKPSNSKPDIYC